VVPAGQVIRRKLYQAPDLLLAPGEDWDAGKCTVKALGDRYSQVVAAPKVRPLVRDDGGQLVRTQHIQGAACHHNASPAAGKAEGGRCVMGEHQDVELRVTASNELEDL
jgi:hypothetical protein